MEQFIFDFAFEKLSNSSRESSRDHPVSQHTDENSSGHDLKELVSLQMALKSVEVCLEVAVLFGMKGREEIHTVLVTGRMTEGLHTASWRS